jgi:serine/threonine protein kinase/Tfp pilus assembly protein PilF
MNDEESIFAEALAIPAPGERAAYLDRACAGDARLRGNIDALLAAHRRAGGILDAPPPAGPEPATESTAAPEPVGTRIGPYKLLERVGGGGMGVVYMAEQVHPVRRKVALKIIKPGMDSGQVIARFEAERQALTMMDHPNIARMLDAGTTDAGRPYFVMELVRGIAITDYCDQARLDTRRRLELFVQVCHAVQHAHQKGVIHRDLKPGNVLVTLHDDKPVPKVIDFGIAKATGHELTDRTLFTNYAQMLGTPLYMSPEQAQISGLDVDTRSDVYSLGVLLYELLTGTTPFDKRRMREAAYDEMRRIIREEDPPRPSTRLSTMGDQLAAVSAHRQTDPKHLGRAVRGELDWIVMKALEKDRGRRYESASSFGRDVERYLVNEAVQACPPSAAYRFRKLARRHQAALLTAVLVGAALLLGTFVSAWQAVRARDAGRAAASAARRAETDAAIARAANDFLNRDLLGQLDAYIPYGRYGESREELKLGAVLDRAAARLDGRFADQPLVEASLRLTIGWTYAGLTRDDPRPLPHLERAAQLRTAHLGPEHPDTLVCLAVLAHEKHDLGALAHVLDVRRRVLGPDHRQTLASMFGLAIEVRDAGDRARGLALLREALAAQRRVLGDDDTATAWTMHCLAHTALLVGGERPEPTAEDPELEWMFRHALAVHLRTRGENWHTFSITQGLGDFLRVRRRYADAESVLRDGIGRLRALPGAPVEHVAALVRSLDAVYRAWGDPARLAAWERERADADRAAVARYASRSVDRTNDPNVIIEHAAALMRLGRPTEAEAAYRAAVDARPHDPWLHQALADTRAHLGRLAPAEAAYREAIRLEPNEGGRHHNLGDVLVRQGRYADAAAEYAEAIRHRPEVAASHGNLGAAAVQLGQWARAAAAFEGEAKLSPAEAWPWIRAAALYAYTGDAEGHRRVRRAALDQFTNATDPNTADRIAKACALLPGPDGEDLRRLERLARVALDGTEKSLDRPWFDAMCALVEYRTGRFDAAAAAAVRVDPGDGGGSRDALTFSVLAMARHRLGRPDDARAALSAAEKILAARMPDPEKGRPFGDDWPDWMHARVVCSEAKVVLAKPAAR